MIALLATMGTTLSGMPCAAIDNRTNTAAFAVPNKSTVTRTYTDYGDNLGFSAYVPRRAWAASRAAETSLRYGEPGYKVSVACRVGH